MKYAYLVMQSNYDKEGHLRNTSVLGVHTSRRGAAQHYKDCVDNRLTRVYIPVTQASHVGEVRSYASLTMPDRRLQSVQVVYENKESERLSVVRWTISTSFDILSRKPKGKANGKR